MTSKAAVACFTMTDPDQSSKLGMVSALCLSKEVTDDIFGGMQLKALFCLNYVRSKSSRWSDTSVFDNRSRFH